MNNKIISSIIFSSILLFTPITSQALFVDLGPFSFNLTGGVGVDTPAYRFYHDPICQAIKGRHLVVLFVETDDAKTERMVVEPYAFGFNENKELILQGYHITDISLHKGNGNNGQGEGQIGGLLTVFNNGETLDAIPIIRVRSIRVLHDSNFVVRKDALKDLSQNNKIIDPICVIR